MSSDCSKNHQIIVTFFCEKNKNNTYKKLKEKHTIKNENNKKIENKLKLKIFSVLILVISITFFFYFIKRNYKINDWFSNKINKNNIQKISNFNSSSLNEMKHAILLLSSYGVDYLNKFLYQFKNDSRFDIYIHLEGKSLFDFKNGETIVNSNIKYCNNIHQSKRFSIEIVDAMYDIMSIANSKYNSFFQRKLLFI